MKLYRTTLNQVKIDTYVKDGHQAEKFLDMHNAGPVFDTLEAAMEWCEENVHIQVRTCVTNRLERGKAPSLQSIYAEIHETVLNEGDTWITHTYSAGIDRRPDADKFGWSVYDPADFEDIFDEMI